MRDARAALADAEGYVEDGLGQEAAELAEEALSLFRELGDKAGAADALVLLLRARCVQERFEEALRLTQEEVRRFRDAGDKLGEAKMRLAAAEAHSGIGGPAHLEQGLAMAMGARTLFKSIGERQHQAMADLAIVKAWRAQKGDPRQRAQSAKQFASEALDIFTTLGDRRGRALALRASSIVQFLESESDAWLATAKQAADIHFDLGETMLEAKELQHIAELHLERGDPKRSWRAAREALELFWSAYKGRYREPPGLVCAIRALVRLGFPHTAQRTARDQLKLAESLQVRAGQAAALDALTWAHLAAGAEDEAKISAERALDLYVNTLGNARGESRVLSKIAWLQIKRGVNAETLDKVRRSMSKFVEIGESEGAVRTLQDLISVYLDKGTPEEAIDVVTSLRADFRASKDLTAEAIALSAICTLHGMAGRWQECSDTARAAAKLFQGQGFNHKEGEALALLAQAQIELDAHKEARESGRKARQCFEQTGDKEQECSMRLLVTQACLTPDKTGSRQMRDAAKESNEALVLAKELKNTKLEVSALTLVAQVLNINKKHEKALQSADEALLLAHDTGDDRAKAAAIIAGADACQAMGRFDDAQEMALEALELAEAQGGPSASHAASARKILGIVEKHLPSPQAEDLAAAEEQAAGPATTTEMQSGPAATVTNHIKSGLFAN